MKLIWPRREVKEVGCLWGVSMYVQVSTRQDSPFEQQMERSRALKAKRAEQQN